MVSLLRVMRPSNNPIGQAVSYMRQSKLQYGILSTYKATVFDKRDNDFRLHLSMSITQNATRPSLRECVAEFTVMAAQDPGYQEHEPFDVRLLSLLFPRAQEGINVKWSKTASFVKSTWPGRFSATFGIPEPGRGLNQVPYELPRYHDRQHNHW
jgi:hypothetical protein